MTPAYDEYDAQPEDTQAPAPAPTQPESHLPGPAWLKVLYVFGVPAAIALFLVWSNTSSQAKDLEKILANQTGIMQQLTAVQTGMTSAQVSMSAFVEMHERAEESRMRVMRQICINTAKDQQGMLKCAE
jgi:hypothetical protein